MTKTKRGGPGRGQGRNPVKQIKEIVTVSLQDITGDVDYSAPIPALPDEFVTWKGKEDGKPRPPIFWLDDETSAKNCS